MNLFKDNLSILIKMATDKEIPTLEELFDKIEEQVEWLDIKPYSHNIIGLTLRMIDDYYGIHEVINAIYDNGLEDKGWGHIVKDYEEKQKN